MKTLQQRIISGDSNKVIQELIKRGEDNTYQMCITSPPYWNLVEYNAGAGDLSMARNEEIFTEGLTNILKGVSRLLEQRGSLVLQWEDLTIDRPDGRTGEYMLSCVNDAAENAGFILYIQTEKIVGNYITF